MTEEEKFIKYRKSFEVAPYALADVIEALNNDQEHVVRIVVSKEDDNLIVFFRRTNKIKTDLNPTNIKE